MYSQLEELLVAGKWREANRETKAVMYKVLGKEDYLSIIDYHWWISIEKVPDTVLIDIDHLWKKHSNNHFGFSIQKRIWDKFYSDTLDLRSTYREFMQAIGWRRSGIDGGYYTYETGSGNNTEFKKLNVFSLKAPQGNLPMFANWDLDGIDEHYHPQAFPDMIERMSKFFARIPHAEE
jgi:hypothetical protein